jgi:predicted nucleotidyltransferase
MTEGSQVPVDETLVVTRALERSGIPYAVGGAIALIYWAEPRGTVDIDINVFLGTDEAERVAKSLGEVGIAVSPAALAEIGRTAQVRLDFAGTPIDLFFSDVPFHDSAQARVVRVPFEGAEIAVLSAEDLVVCKAMFNRRKDWADIEQVLYTRGAEFDAAYVRGWLTEMLGSADRRLAEFEAICLEVGTE